MFQDWIRQANGQQQDVLKPLAQINTMLLDNVAKLSKYQIDALDTYTQSQIEYAKKLNDAAAKGDTAMVGQVQMSQMADLNKRFMQDCKSFLELNEGLRKEFSQVFADIAKEEVKG
ncbi:phasin family protein [Gallaecimonas pentaromativorans]|uniref:phasin family protein n=1 Tax=Gallaecimonas pentaromativorans TaxID=584787 RepID=UPI00067EB4F3|nr:phasin family protein [Gallaecimonas pentaromativorans]MED5526594.1 phasin family protein [Pseudomonadota bacterium]